MQTAGTTHTLITTVYLLLLCCSIAYCQDEAACNGLFRADVIFALDSSGSVIPESFRKMESFSKRVIQSLPIHPDSGFQIGAMGFSDSAWTPIDLMTYPEKESLLQGFHIQYNEGGSNTTAALEAFRTMFTEERGDRPDKPNIAIVMVDGGSYDPVLTWMQSVVTRQHGVHLIAIGIGTKITSKSFLLELEGIATGPYRQNVYTVASFDDLNDIEMVSNVTKLLCNDKNECSSNPCLNEAGCYDSIEAFICNCPPGFTGQICQIASGRVMDLLFVVEVSNQVDPANYGAILELMQRIVRQMNVAPQASRVGVVLFGSRGQVLIRLDTYSNKYDIMHALAMLQFTFIGGDPDAAGAIQLVKQHFQQVPATDSTEQRIAFFIVSAKSVEKKVADASLSLRLQGVEIFVLTYGSLDLTTRVDLYSMVSRPGSSQLTTLFVAETKEDFISLAPNITYMIYNNLNWCATAPCENDGKCTNQLLDYTCECPESATGKQCETACSRHMDLAFLVDTSRTMGQHFLMAIQFAKELIHRLDFRFEGVKLALVTLGPSPVLRFDLDEYTTKREILEAFTLPGIGGKTNLVAGLSMLKEQVFVNDRNGVDDIAILITDGNIYQSRSQIQRALESLNEGDTDVEDIAVYVVAVGKNVDHDFVKRLHPEHRPVYLRGQPDLASAVDATMANICG